MSDPTFADTRFDMGRTVSQTFGVIGRNPVSVFIICGLVQVISLGLSYLIRMGVAGYGFQVQTGMTGAADGLLGLVTRAMLLGSVTFIAVNDLSGHRVPFGAAVAAGFRTLLPVLGINIIASIAVGFASILLVVPGIILFLRWLVAVPVRVVEGPGVGAALSRSAELTKGCRWALFGLVLGYAILAGAAAYGASLVSGGFLASAVARAHADPAALIVQLVSSAILSAISTSGVAAIYIELRRVKDGTSVEQLAAVFG